MFLLNIQSKVPIFDLTGTKPGFSHFSKLRLFDLLEP